MPAWALVYAAFLLLGLISGLLLRFFLVLVGVLVGAVGFAWLLGYVNTAQLAEGWGDLRTLLTSAGIPSTFLFTVVGIVFLVGMCGGVLLTSRLRALDWRAVA